MGLEKQRCAFSSEHYQSQAKNNTENSKIKYLEVSKNIPYIMQSTK